MSYNQNKFKFNLFNETINIKSIIQNTDKSLDIIFNNLALENKENKEEYIRLTIDEMAVCNTNEVPLANPKQTFVLDKNNNGLLLLPNNELIADLDKNERPYIKTINVETSKVIVEFNIAVQPNETAGAAGSAATAGATGSAATAGAAGAAGATGSAATAAAGVAGVAGAAGVAIGVVAGAAAAVIAAVDDDPSLLDEFMDDATLDIGTIFVNAVGNADATTLINTLGAIQAGNIIKTFYNSTPTIKPGIHKINNNMYLNKNQINYEVEVIKNVVYGENITVKPALQGLPPAKEALLCDIYKPKNKQENSPLILIFHDGNFLPPYFNNTPYGTKSDYWEVQMATKYAEKGYVVAVCDYRLGWNYLASTQVERTKQLMQALYRGIQDSLTAVRFFRKTVAENENLYNIDENKIAMFGNRTGGAITLAAASLNTYDDFIYNRDRNPITKFWEDDFASNDMSPFIIESIHGDLEATTGRTLCIANHLGYSSAFNFQMNVSGFIGDLTWFRKSTPIVSFHQPHDAYFPYLTAVLVNLNFNLDNIVEVSGSYDLMIAKKLGANDSNSIFANIPQPPNISYPNLHGLYDIKNKYINDRPSEPNSTPWMWFDKNPVQQYDEANGTTIATTFSDNNPSMSKTEANKWINIMIDYTTPRMEAAFNAN